MCIAQERSATFLPSAKARGFLSQVIMNYYHYEGPVIDALDGRPFETKLDVVVKAKSYADAINRIKYKFRMDNGLNSKQKLILRDDRIWIEDNFVRGKCPECGGNLSDGENFCPSCGWESY